MKKTEESLPEEQKLGQPSYLFRMRANKRSSKSAALFDEGVLPDGIDKENMAAKLEEALEKVPGYRPVAKIAKRSPGGRPLEVISPNGTLYVRKKALGFFLSFIEAAILASLPNPKLLADHIAVKEIDVEQVEAILQPAGPAGFVKMQELVVTPELLKAAEDAQKSGERRGKDGIPDQAASVVQEGVNSKLASANHIATLLQLQATGLKLCEWLHLIMFFLLRIAAQNIDNLTGGTKAANTDMMIAENATTTLVKLLKEKVELKVESFEMGFHFAKEIRFTIVTKYFSLPFVFDALTTLAPSLEDHDYMQAFLITLVAEIKTLLAPKCAKVLFSSAAKPKLPPIPKMSVVFFKREPTAPKKDSDVALTTVPTIGA